MLQQFPLLPHILLASTFAVSAVAFAVPPPSPAPVPVPYPNTSPRDPASGLPTGRRIHKPIRVVTPTSIAAPTIFAQPASCAPANAQPVNGAALDPEEGGQVATADKATSKVSFQPFSVTRKIDKSSPVLLDSSASGGACH
jgi:hypothetical protein